MKIIWNSYWTQGLPLNKHAVHVNCHLYAPKVKVKSQDLDSFRYITVVRSHKTAVLLLSVSPVWPVPASPTPYSRDWHLPHACLRLQLATVLIKQVVRFSSVAQSCLTLCDPKNHSTPGLPVHPQLPDFTQTQVHWVGDAIPPSHPLSSPFPPAPNFP